MVVANSHLPLRNLSLSCFCLQSNQAAPLRRQVGFTAHQIPEGVKASVFKVKWQLSNSSKRLSTSLRCSSGTSSSSNMKNDSTGQDKTPFGYSRKDVLLIGVGVTAVGWGLKSGLEYFGVDPLQAGNVVQLVIVLGLTVGWISTYLFRVSNKEMTYAQQLRDYEKKVMEKRLESLSEAELEALLEQVEEEKRRLVNGEQIN